LKEMNDDRREAVIDKARDAKESAIKEMSEPSQELLNKVYKDLKNSEIDETEYYEHLAEIRKLNNEEEGDVSENFISYIKDNLNDVNSDLKDNVIAGQIDKNITDARQDVLRRAERVETMNAGNPSSTSKYLREQGNKLLNAGRAISGTLIGVSIGVGTYIDSNYNDKTGGEAFAKNATDAAVTVGLTSGTAYAVSGIATALGAATPVGWAVLGGVAVGTVATTVFNWAYDNNIISIQDHLDGAGQYIDKVGEQINEGWNRAKDAVSDGINKVGEAFSSGLDAINPWS